MLDAVTTFQCAGCGQRVPLQQLWARHASQRQALAQGEPTTTGYVHGKKTWVLSRLCCSEACDQRAPIRTVMAWCCWLAGETDRGRQVYYEVYRRAFVNGT